MNINIRIAEKKDCPRILELVRELALYEKAPAEVTVTLDEFTEAGFGHQPVWKGFVATENEMIVGVALFYIRFSTWKGCLLYLEDFIVTEACRGKGVGKLLFDSVIKEAKDKNYNGVCWQVLDWNQPALNFYNKYSAYTESGWLNASLSKAKIIEF